MIYLYLFLFTPTLMSDIQLNSIETIKANYESKLSILTSQEKKQLMQVLKALGKRNPKLAKDHLQISTKRVQELCIYSNLPDDENPNYLYQMTHTKLLVQIANGEIDARQMALQELGNR